MVELEERARMFGGLERKRNFRRYISELPAEVDILSEILARLESQDRVYFFDLGCGDGNAGEGKDGVFEVVRERLIVSGRDDSLVDKLNYIGVDLLPNSNPQTRRQQFINYDIEDIHRIIEELPKIDVGLSFQSFPYFERKMEILEVLARHLNREGVLIVHPFYEDLTMVHTRTTPPLIPSNKIYNDCFDADLRNNSLVVRGFRVPVSERVKFRGSEVYHTCPNIKGTRYAQMISRYDAIPPPQVNIAA